MIKLYMGGSYGEFYYQEVKVNFFTFPDGTRHIKIDLEDLEEKERMSYKKEFTHFLISAFLETDAEILDILLLNDAIHRDMFISDSALDMHYMPGARQDRVMVDGEPLSAKVYADLINSCGFDVVHVLDPHSSVITALINNCNAVEPIKLWNEVNTQDNTVVIAPDAGARKRAESFAKQNGIKELYIADKTRDLNTGKITDFNLYATRDQIEGKHVVIVDDIVTGGGTFLGLLGEIKKLNPDLVDLVVTHSDTFEGVFNMCQNFNHVYITSSRNQKAWQYGRLNVTVVDVL